MYDCSILAAQQMHNIILFCIEAQMKMCHYQLYNASVILQIMGGLSQKEPSITLIVNGIIPPFVTRIVDICLCPTSPFYFPPHTILLHMQ